MCTMHTYIHTCTENEFLVKDVGETLAQLKCINTGQVSVALVSVAKYSDSFAISD